MRVIQNEKLDLVNLEEHERFFVELMYSMTHMNSLDSYRVKCMNSRTIIRELVEETNISLIKDDELKSLCTETFNTLSEDPIIEKYFSYLFSQLNPSLKNPPELSRRKGRSKEEERFLFLLEDFSVALEKSYFECLSRYILSAVKPDNSEEIKLLVNSLLSDLIDKGWPIKTLFSWHEHFLSTKKEKKYSFAENLSFMLRVFARPSENYNVILRLSGSEKAEKIGKFNKFILSQEPPIPAGVKVPKKFSRTNPLTCFAQTEVTESDFLSAAINAKEEFEQIIDLLRFDYEQRSLKIENVFHVTRVCDGKTELPVVLSQTPNPRENIGRRNFIDFNRHLQEIFESGLIEESSCRQLQAAIRQYRFGRDCENFKDKFLNWWMGLEALCHIERGKGIGPTVAQNVSSVMAVSYPIKLLRDLLTTLKYCELNWPKELADAVNCKELNDLTLDKLFEIFQTEALKEVLYNECKPYPTLSYRMNDLSCLFSDTKVISSRLESHRNNLEWHLNRIYRIRCCIVHGSEIRLRLGLVTANLEYYLKQVILIVLRTFHEKPHVNNLSGLFARALFSHERSLNSLKAEDAANTDIRKTIFSNVVVSE